MQAAQFHTSSQAPSRQTCSRRATELSRARATMGTAARTDIKSECTPVTYLLPIPRLSNQQREEVLPASSQLFSSPVAKRVLLVAPFAAACASLTPNGAQALQLQGAPCRGYNGYSLQRCLRDAKREQEQKEGEDGGTGGDITPGGRGADPGNLVTLPSGRQYRELLEGYGERRAQIGDELEIQYTVYQLNKVVPILLWSLGSGFENRDDVDDVYRFRLGDPGSLPAAAVPAVEGMKVGSRRQVLIPPEEGWVDDLVEPRPVTFGGKRRLISHYREPLLFEAICIRIV